MEAAMTTTSPPSESHATSTTEQGPRRLAQAGLLVGLGMLLPLSLRPCFTLHPTAESVWGALAFTASGVTALLLTAALWNRALLRGRMRGEVQRGNLAAGIVAATHSAGTGLLASHCFAADALANLPVGAVFFVVAEVALVALSLLFRALTDYADDQEILGENCAAAVSYSGVVLALSLIVGHASSGAFLGWIPALRSFGLFLLWAVLLYPVRQIVVARLLLGHPLRWRGGGLDHAVARERDVVVSCVEAAGYLAAALLAMGLS
jgi:uncharacterized membrane protein YjfL (UPF0719 family)